MDWTIEASRARSRQRKISPVEATQECLDRIARLDGRLRAFITVDADGALAAARALDADAAAGRWRGPLHGVPLAYKDLCHIRGLPTSCGTKTAEYFIAERRRAPRSRRLRAAGAVTLGKLNMTELALGPFGDNAHHGHAQNPVAAGPLPRAARRAARAPPSPPGSRSARSAPTPAAPSGCRRRAAASSGSSPRTAA